MATRNDIRKAFKELGYKVQFKTNPLTNRLTTLTVTTADDKWVIGGDVYLAEHIAKHKAAFDLFRSVKGTVTEDTQQKIT